MNISAPTSSVSDKRKFIIAAVTLGGIIVLCTVVFTLNARYFEPDPGTQAANQVVAVHPALDEPNSGHKPTSSGDRGGWEQLALLGLIVVAIGGGATRLVVSSRKVRRRNAAEASDLAARQPLRD